MKKLNLNIVWALLIGVALITGCKKEDTSSQPANTFVEPSIAANTEVVKLPASMMNSQDPYVSMINGYAQLVNGLAHTSSYLAAIPSNAQQTALKASGTSWTWSDNQGNAVWVEQIDGSDHYTWNYYVKYTGMTSRFLYLTVSELKTKLGGSLQVYDPQKPTVTTAALDYNWTKDNAGVVTATILFASSTSPMFFTITSKLDTSGNMKIYNGSSASGTLFANFTWDATGHGNYVYTDTSGHQYTSTF